MIFFVLLIADPKLKNVNFEYLVNGQKLELQSLSSTNMKRIFGDHEYSIVGEYDTDEGLNEIQIIMKAEDINGTIEKMISLKPCVDTPIALPTFENPQNLLENAANENIDLIMPKQRCIPTIPSNQIPNSGWKYSPSEDFMSRLWAFKRINYLLKNKTSDSKVR